jgi:CO/xanthine dehydrogenase FAD-binding subunit
VITTQGQHIQEARIALGAITPVPLRATLAETVLLDESLPLRDYVIERCLAVLAMELQEPLDDIWASAAYRVMMGKALVRKALNNLRSLEHENEDK